MERVERLEKKMKGSERESKSVRSSGITDAIKSSHKSIKDRDESCRWRETQNP